MRASALTKSMWTVLSSARKRLCSAKEFVEFPVGCGLDSAAREPENLYWNERTGGGRRRPEEGRPCSSEYIDFDRLTH